MCRSDKQNMGGIIIHNVVSKVISFIVESLRRAKPTRNPNDNDIENRRTELKNLVEEARGAIDNGECLKSIFIDKLNEAEIYGDTIDYVFHNNFRDLDLNQIKSYLDQLFNQLKDFIRELPTSQSSCPEMENINIQLGNVRRCLLLLYYFPEHFVFNLKRVTRLSVPNDVIPEKLEQLPEFLDIIGEASNHFLLKANGRTKIRNFPEWDNLSRQPSLEGIKSEQNKDSYPTLFFKVGTDITNLPDFTKWEFMLLRYLSLREVNMRNGENLNLNQLSSLKYLDLKHTKVKDCSWFECLEKLQMLDLRYTYVKEIPDNILEKLGKLQHLLLGYIKEEGENQLAGPKLNVKKLNTTNLKTLRAIEQPESIEEISNVTNVVDLSVTGLTMNNLPTFWSTLERFENLTSLGVAMTDQSDITLQDCGIELKRKLKRLWMEGLDSRFEKLGEFENLNDLTLASHKTIDINSIPVLPNLLCLRLYGVCQKTTCQIGLQGFGSLKMLVIGDMGKVETLQIGSAVFETVATLKFSNLPLLKEVAYTDEHHSHSLLRWGNSTAQVCSREVQLNKTIFLRHFEDFPVDNSPGLKIYHDDISREMRCYKLLNTTKNNQG